MAKVLVVNADNNMGDCLTHMRCLKEYKKRNPDTLDFITCYWLHYEVARHTDLFQKVTYNPNRDEVLQYKTNYPGYDKVISFTIDWGTTIANKKSLCRGWCLQTLGFEPENDTAYFKLFDEDWAQAKYTISLFRKSFQKFALLTLNAPSNIVRSMLPEDWPRVIEMFPRNWGLFFPAPVTAILEFPIPIRGNVLLLPGYPLGATGALMKLVDLIVVVHGGMAHLAQAVEAKPIIYINYLQENSPELLVIPWAKTLFYPNNKSTNWDELKKTIEAFL